MSAEKVVTSDTLALAMGVIPYSVFHLKQRFVDTLNLAALIYKTNYRLFQKVCCIDNIGSNPALVLFNNLEIKKPKTLIYISVTISNGTAEHFKRVACKQHRLVAVYKLR